MSPKSGLQNSFSRVARYLAAPFRIGRQAYLRKRYRDHAFAQAFDWQWEKTNYNRIALINLLIAKKREPAYLEIGCASNSLFDSVPCSDKVGVDPAAGGTVRATSDDFFAKNSKLFDVVFIDGLHTYDQVRRDVINAIRFLKPGGYVALHDMLPGTWIEHHVPRISDEWTGDVWKVAFELTQTGAIDFRLVRIDHGVGVFRLRNQQAALVDLNGELKDQEFEYLYRNIQKLPLIEWQQFLTWLAEGAPQS